MDSFHCTLALSIKFNHVSVSFIALKVMDAVNIPVCAYCVIAVDPWELNQRWYSAGHYKPRK